MYDSHRKLLNVIFALIIAFGGWIYVVYNFYPTKDISYNDVPITFTGEDKLADNGFGIKSSNYQSVNITLKQLRADTNRINLEDIKVYADVSELVEGENGVSLEVIPPDKTEVSDISINTIHLSIEESKTMDFDVMPEYLDSMELGIEPIAKNMSFDSVTITGARSEVEKIDKVVCQVDIKDVTNNPKTFILNPQAVDSKGKAITHLIIRPQEISADISSGTVKEVDLIHDITSGNDDYYERKYELPKKITIKGSAKAVKSLESVKMKNIDIRNIYEDEKIKLEYELPEGVYIANKSKHETLNVKVKSK